MSRLKLLRSFLITSLILMATAGFMLDGYRLAWRFLITIIALGLIYTLILLRFELSPKVAKHTGIILPVLAFGILALI